MIPGYRAALRAPAVTIDLAAEKAASERRRAESEAYEWEAVRRALQRADEAGFHGCRVGIVLGTGKGRNRCHCGELKASRAKECRTCGGKRPCLVCQEPLGEDAPGPKHQHCKRKWRERAKATHHARSTAA